MIRLELYYSCGGCHAYEKREAWIKRQFLSFSGREYGFGNHVFDSQKTLVDETCPAGWMAFDPYTSATYCPTCWDEIVEGVAEDIAKHEEPRDAD